MKLGVGECHGTQQIEIEYHDRKTLRKLTLYQQGQIYAQSYCNEDLTRWATVKVDGELLGKSQIKELALNDGFASQEDFFDWFKQDFTGKIIHWTPLRYPQR